MSCRQFEELILESFDAPPSERGAVLDAHLPVCQSCRRFQASQNSLHALLSARYAPPELSEGFRAGLRRRVKAEKRRALWDAMPDLLHLGGGFIATGACAVFVPLPTQYVLAAGIGFTLGTYLLQTLVRMAFEEADAI